MYRVFNCLNVEHDWRLVALAALVCFFASLAAINLFFRAKATAGRIRATWTFTAGAAAGCGIWATHFIAMLAYAPGIPTGYNFGLTALSLFAAVAVTTAGLGFAIYHPSRWNPAIGGAFVGAGVACMHYLGMWALEVPGRVTWSIDLVLASILFGLVLGAAALAVAARGDSLRGMLQAALLLTLAIVSHHFTAMGAVEIVPDPTRIIESFLLSPDSLATVIAGGAISVLGMCVVAAIADQRSQEKMREQNRRLDAALNNMCQGLCMFDAEDRLLINNERYIQMYGLDRDLIGLGCSLEDLIAYRVAAGTFTGEPRRYIADVRASIAEGKTGRSVTELPDGRAIEVVTEPIAGGGWVATHEDITEGRRAQREIEGTRAFLDAVVEAVPSPIVVKDARDQRYVLVNRAGEEFFGASREHMIGKTVHEVFPKVEADAIRDQDSQAIKTSGLLFKAEHPVQTLQNTTRLVTTKRIAIRNQEGEPQYLLAVIDDVTERKRAEARIAHMAHHDPLTNLPNRAAFNECLEALLADPSGRETFAVLCLDLDRFKDVNDVFGHSIGDSLLCEIAHRLEKACQGAFLARLGGDEFTIICAGDQPAAAEALASRLSAAVADDIEIAGHLLRTSVTIGIALHPSDGNTAPSLLANADAALYRAKAEGRGAIRFFQPEMDEKLRQKRALQHDLRSAITRGELFLDYQPETLISGEVKGFEALVRWQHPVRGRVPPLAFVPLAEESGLIISIGEWILRETCREAASWQNPLQIAINLSPVQFQHGDLPALVHSVLLETGLKPSRLELEITESVLIHDSARALSVLRRLKALGVRIAMDDFGTGYSSLSYLQAFPFDKIKIDRSFISKIEHNNQSAAIVRAVIGLGRGLDLPVVAEGVETEAQLAFLKEERCAEVQGYLMGRPGPIRDYDAFTGSFTPPLAPLEKASLDSEASRTAKVA